MDKVFENANAKINLSLDVLGQLENGYHEVEMILQEIDLADEIIIEKKNDGIELVCDVDFLPTDSNNLAWRAAEKMIHLAQLSSGVKLTISKRIPVAAGLAGGSADAAAVIRGMDRLFELGLPLEVQLKLALSLGADVPFCLGGGCALAKGIGEVLTPVEGFGAHWVLLAKPNIGVSTPVIYQRFDEKPVQFRPDTAALISAIQKDDLRYVSEHMINVLEPVTCQMHPIVGNIRRQMLQCGAMGAMMSGSGPTVFGFFKHYDRVQKAYKNLRKTYAQVYISRTVRRG